MIQSIGWKGKAHSVSHSPARPPVEQRLNQTLHALPLPPPFYLWNERLAKVTPCSQWSLQRSPHAVIEWSLTPNH